jgi:diguanylate cyclase (GGDEF)-like protein
VVAGSGDSHTHPPGAALGPHGLTVIRSGPHSGSGLSAAGPGLLDALTGLPQRPMAREWLVSALASAPAGHEVAVALVNVDGFSVVIDSLGMAAADAALQQVAGRLRAAASAWGLGLARAGGDEFALVLPRVTEPAETERLVADVVEAAFGRPFSVQGQVLYLTASSGIAASAPADPDELLRRATVALASVKRAGGGRAATFQHRSAEAPRNLALYGELREAMGRGELSAHYQPIVDVNDSRVVGLEALLRWNHPVRGVVGPAEFLPPIAGSLLIEDLGMRVLRKACQDAAELMQSHPDLRYVAVNVAPRQLTGAGFRDQVLAALTAADLGPEHLVLEITETALVDDLSIARSALNALRAHGIRVALDDFGTGYATLTSLRQLPIDMLKIDRTFVSGLGASDQDATIVASVVSLARSIGIDAVAEGVETPRQAEAVRAVGCGLGQGYHWSAAVPATDLPATIAQITSGGRAIAGRRGRAGQAQPAGPVETRRIIELHRAGASAPTIAAALNQAGMQTKAGRRWHPTQVTRVIQEALRRAEAESAEPPSS